MASHAPVSAAPRWSLLPLLLPALQLASAAAAVPADPSPGGGEWIDDGACIRCHEDVWRSYREVGMSRSFASGEAAEVIEDYEGRNRFFHQPSGRWYEMTRRAGRPVFRRWQLDRDGQPILGIELEVDWVLGSGHTSRTYLVHQPAGELYQLPLAWYTQEESWGMAPGYDRPDHLGILRRVERECMFCHNAYPRATDPRRFPADRPVFPRELPQGTGCQRCHGPGGRHAEAVIGGADAEAVRRAIVNPARLAATARDDVCRQCHLQPSVALMPVRRFGREVESFRAGQAIDDYIVHMDPVEEGDPEDRFEINHHPYRLEQSRCWQESGALSCLTCHDPHRKVPTGERAAHYRAACLGCHAVEACGRPRAPSGGAGGHPATETADCAGCHMPRRRTRDVVHVAMTDHRIQLPPGGDLLAPLAEVTPTLVDMRLLYPERSPTGPLAEVYKSLAVLKVGGGANALDHLQRNLQRADPPFPEPWLALGRGQLLQRRFEAASETLARFDRQWPGDRRALVWRGVAAIGLGRHEEAETFLRRALTVDPGSLDARHNLALLLAQTGRLEEAIGTFRSLLEQQPFMPRSWYRLGTVLEAMGRREEAESALRQALTIDPSATRAYVALGRLLVARGAWSEAERTLSHGSRWATRGNEVAAAWRALSAERGESAGGL